MHSQRYRHAQLITLCMLAVGFVLVSSSLFAAEEEKKEKGPAPLRVKGNLIPHPESKDIKVLTENYETVTVIVNDKTRINASVKGNLDYMSQEAGLKLPQGEVTYTEVDGKFVATGVTYTSSETWKMEPPKLPEEE